MILLLHITIALLSIAVASLTFFKPSIRRIGMSYGLIVATIGSGTALIFINQASIIHVCISGLTYTTIVTLITIATHARIRRQSQLPAEFKSER